MPLAVALGAKAGESAQPLPNKSPRMPNVDQGPIYELRIYAVNKDRLGHLIKRFRNHTDRIFRKHHMEAVGYWLPTDGTPRQRRKFVYILKHPSRYAAYKNWTAFSNDREWEAVLDEPEFRGLLSERPSSIFMTANDYAAKVRDPITKPGGTFELRTYTSAKGKLAPLNARFSEQTSKLFRKHSMANLGYWTPFDRPESTNTLIYLLHHSSRDHADKNWRAFGSDPAWLEVARDSQREGKLLSKNPERLYLKPTDFSPLR